MALSSLLQTRKKRMEYDRQNAKIWHVRAERQSSAFQRRYQARTDRKNNIFFLVANLPILCPLNLVKNSVKLPLKMLSCDFVRRDDFLPTPCLPRARPGTKRLTDFRPVSPRSPPRAMAALGGALCKGTSRLLEERPRRASL